MVTSAGLRIVFFGTPAFAVPSLEVLIEPPHRVVAVVTRPDRPRGRGQHTTDAPVKARAVAASVPVFQPERLKDPEFRLAIADLRADLGVVAAYGRLLPPDLLTVPRLGMINVHASLLPRYRGAAPVHRAVMAGESETGVTIMRVAAALDAGPMLAALSRPIGPDETSEEVERDLAVLGAGLVRQVVDELAVGPVPGMPQDETEATYAPRLTREDGFVNWAVPAREIHDQIRGLYPWPHASAFLMGRRLILLRSRVSDVAADAPAGTVIKADAEGLAVATSQGTLVLLDVQPEGRRPMAIRDFLAGHPVSPGDRFAAAP
jgi:methionyl-tRNA formyltransferase